MANRFLTRVRGIFRMKYTAPVIKEADQSRQVDNNGFRAYAGQGFSSMFDESPAGAGDSRYSKAMADVMKLAADKKEWCERLEQVRGSDVYETITAKVADDLIYRHNHDALTNIDNYFTIQIEGNQKVTNALALLPHQYGFGRVLAEIAPEMLAIGEYILKVDHDNRTISDAVDQKNTIVISADGRPRWIVNVQTKEMFDASDYIVLNLGTTAKKVSFSTDDGTTYTTRLGRSIFSVGVLNKMNSLKLLEAIVPISEIMNIDQKMYYHLRVPPGTPVKDAYRMVKDYELMLYSILNPETKTTYDDIIHSVGKVKVVPLFGNQEGLNEKSLAKMDRIELDYLNDIRTNIASLVGIPPSYIGAIDKDSPNALAAYYQKIAFLRSRVANGFKNTVMDFIDGHRADVNLDDMSMLAVTAPEILGVQDIDAIDYLAVTSDLTNNTNQVIQSAINTIMLMEQAGYMDVEGYKRTTNAKLMPLLDRPIFIVPDDDGTPPVGQPPKLPPPPAGSPDSPGVAPGASAADASPAQPAQNTTKDNGDDK